MLTNALTVNQIPHWRDSMQMSVGQSIVSNVQQALEDATFMCIVLSENSIKSEWVERELTAGLVRELEIRKLTILPIIIDDCRIPLFLRGKLYADFRNDFDEGFKSIRNALSDNYNLHAGKITNNGKCTSFGTDIVLSTDKIIINFDIISEDDDADYYILTKVIITGNAEVLRQYNICVENDEEKNFIKHIISLCGQKCIKEETAVVVSGKTVGQLDFTIDDTDNSFLLDVNIISKKIGADNRKFVAFPVACLFKFVTE